MSTGSIDFFDTIFLLAKGYCWKYVKVLFKEMTHFLTTFRSFGIAETLCNLMVKFASSWTF